MTTTTSEPIKFTPEVIAIAKESAKRDYITCDVNLSKRTAVLRSESDAPLLTADVLLKKGDPTTTVIMNVGADEPLEVEVLNGVPFSVEAAQLRLALNEDLDEDELARTEARLLVSTLVVFPKFTTSKRKRKGVINLDDYPDELLIALSQACGAVINPEEDDVYQVRIKREFPDATDKRIVACFKRFPKATMLINTQPAKLTAKQAKQVERLRHALRDIVLEDLIVSPNLFTNDSDKENIADGFPLAVLSESIKQVLFSSICKAHKLPNIL